MEQSFVLSIPWKFQKIFCDYVYEELLWQCHRITESDIPNATTVDAYFCFRDAAMYMHL